MDAAAAALPAVLPPARVERLANGLTLCLVENRQAPLVTSALVYRAGSRDDPPGQGGMAHFLEHMMFKGSRRFAVGEIDRLTRLLGGTNNAFTGHDATLYYFSFAADRWHAALEIEADRMSALALDGGEVDSERRVIRHEIAMYQDEPWDALELEVSRARFPDHPYGRPVLGTAGELARIDGPALAAFHRRYYRPDNAVLVLAGDLDDGAFDAAARAFEDAGRERGEALERPALAAPGAPAGMVRRVRRQGELPRLLLALPAPPAAMPEHARLRLLLAVLGSGRRSRLHRALVDEGELCAWVSCDLTETAAAGTVLIAAEVLPGVEPQRVEEEIFDRLRRLIAAPPSAAEIARARRLLQADWAFAHERVHQQATEIALALALFDLEQPARQWAEILAAGREELHEVAARFLRVEDAAVVGWSLPRDGGGDGR